MTTAEERAPVWVQCKPCGHKWIGLYTPMLLSDAASVMRSLRCPSCGRDNHTIHFTDLPKACA